jgi:hypothetical protein
MLSHVRSHPLPIPPCAGNLRWCPSMDMAAYNAVCDLSGAGEMKIDGSCHCGRITYQAEVDSETVVICHCTDCQTLSGSAFRTVVPTREGTFTLLTGRPKIYVKVGESGNEREQAFCADCGSPIYSAPPGAGTKIVGLRVGTIRQRDQLLPNDQYWFRSAQKWIESLSAINKTEKQPTFGPTGAFGR